jgi:hypothetical protein
MGIGGLAIDIDEYFIQMPLLLQQNWLGLRTPAADFGCKD